MPTTPTGGGPGDPDDPFPNPWEPDKEPSTPK